MTLLAYRFVLNPTPAQERTLRSHAGAARVAFSWGLARVKASLGQRAAEASYGLAGDDLTPGISWSLYSLRKDWNAARAEVAPWWGECSDAALALILVVVAVAANGYRLAGILAAISAAVWFDFFLTQPYEHFTITRRADIETTVLLLVIGVAVTELAVWGRRQHADASRRAGYLDGINAAAHAVAAGSSATTLIDQVSDQLKELLSLRECRFQYGVAGEGKPARLQHDGQVTEGARILDLTIEGLPQRVDTELLVENGGILQGRFLMSADPDARPTLEQRLVAIAFAEQVGAALAASHPVES